MSRIIIIGAGPGGYETAVAAAKQGFEVVIISDGNVGGTCLNEGCIPTKSFCKNAEVLEELKRSELFGINDLSYSFDFSKVVERKNQVVEQLRGGVEFLLKGKNISLVRGRARFKDTKTVIVSSEDSSVDGTELSGDYFIVASGSSSAMLPIEGIDGQGVITSKEILDLSVLPKRLCVIGAGVIGLEFASVFTSFGTEVSVIEYCKDILPRFDTDLAKRLKQSLSKRGILIETSSQVTKIESSGSAYKVFYTKKETESFIEADKVLVAVGRRPNVDDLGLEDAGIEFSKRGIPVDENMRTNIPHIFAIGDVTGGLMLAHTAIFQGKKVLDFLEGKQSGINLSIVPACVFTYPEVATVGMTEDECKENGIPVKCLKSFHRANGKALSMAEPEGYCKILVYTGESNEDFEKGMILGCHIFGAHSSDVIQEIAVLMNMKAKISDLQDIIHSHPTLTEVVQEAAHTF